MRGTHYSGPGPRTQPPCAELRTNPWELAGQLPFDSAPRESKNGEVNTPLLRIDRDRLLELDLALTREWLETDGRGGYASSTVLMCPTRRYHGLLVSSFPGSDKRHVFLSRFEESVHATSQAPIGREGESSFPLSMARYPGSFHPHGHKALESFELAPFPRFHYRFGDVRVTRSIQSLKGQAAVLVRYDVEGGDEPIELRLRALVAFREADALTFENVDLHPEVHYLDNARRVLRMRPYDGLPPMTLALAAPDGAFEGDPVWYRNLEYKVDLERGYAGREDNFSPGLFRVRLAPGESAIVCASLEDAPQDLAELWTRCERERDELAQCARPGVPLQLDLGADDFLYRTRDGRRGVVAGFPWFTEWGRDTFISLPGLLLARGRTPWCGEILSGAARFLNRGLLPNVFGAQPETSHYGSVDAALWYARCVRSYELAGGDPSLVQRRLRPALAEIAENYARGTLLGITCDAGGLIRAGDGRINPTWMDAVVGGVAVTPRDGCAVELNALWYALLAYLEELAARAGDTREAAQWRARKELTGRSFLERFWLAEPRYLADTWKDGVLDRSVRPNMVIAAALELSPLSRAQRADIVHRAELELLTPRGLRTLAPCEREYRGRFHGGPEERDRAYHQGTVWPWLTGFYCEAVLRAHGGGAEVVARLRAYLRGFEGELATHGLNHVSEVYDGDPPHRPGGCIAQAWSTAELLRAHALLEEAGRS